MTRGNLDAQVAVALEILPADGKPMEFNAYKAKLYAAMPDGGRDAFERILLSDLCNKSMSRDSNGKPAVMLSKKVGA